MSTYRELIYMVADEVKLLSDDSTYTEDHIKFLLKKYRTYLIMKKYEETKDYINNDNKQRICVELQSQSSCDPCDGFITSVSNEKIPGDIGIGSIKIYNSLGFPLSNVCFVPFERFEYVGYNKYLKSITYCAIGPSGNLFLKSHNPLAGYLNRILIDGVFGDPEEADKLQCKCDDDANLTPDSEDCDIMNMKFPIEEALIPTLIQSVVKELTGAIYKPKDPSNNALDDLSDIASFIRKNMKSQMVKQIEGDE